MGSIMFPFKKKKTNVIEYTAQNKEADSYLNAVLNAAKTIFSRGGGGGFGISPDGSRDYNELFGYPANPDYQYWKELYDRGGIAGVVVDKPAKLCWRDMATIKSGDDEILADQMLMLKRAGFFNAMERSDIANRIGRFSVLFVGVPDGLDPSLPIGSASKDSFKGMYFNVYEENGIEVTKYDTDPASARFNLPELYQLQTIGDTDSKLQSNRTARTVHFSRVIHFAEGGLSSSIEGVSSLKRPLNALIDKEKVRGSSSEATFRNSRQKIALEADKDTKVDRTDGSIEKLKENAENFQNGQEDFLRLRGMKANAIQPSLASPRDQFDICVEEVAGSSGIPVRFLTTKAGGAVTGSEDKASLNALVLDRQDQECTPWLLSGLGIMSEAGILDLPDVVEVVWPVQSSLSEKEATESSKNKADAFKSVADGLSTVGGDEVLAKSVFKVVGLDEIEVDDIDLTNDDELDKDL